MAPPEIFWSLLHAKLEQLVEQVKQESTLVGPLDNASLSILSLRQTSSRVVIANARDTVMPLLEKRFDNPKDRRNNENLNLVLKTMASVAIMMAASEAADGEQARLGTTFLKDCCVHSGSSVEIWTSALGLLLDVRGSDGSGAVGVLKRDLGNLFTFYFVENNGEEEECEYSYDEAGCSSSDPFGLGEDDEDKVWFNQGAQRLLSIVVELLRVTPPEDVAEVFGCVLSEKTDQQARSEVKKSAANSSGTLNSEKTPPVEGQENTLLSLASADDDEDEAAADDDEDDDDDDDDSHAPGSATPTLKKNDVLCGDNEDDDMISEMSGGEAVVGGDGEEGEEDEAMTVARFLNGALGSKDASVKQLALEVIAMAAAKDPSTFCIPAAAIFARVASAAEAPSSSSSMSSSSSSSSSSSAAAASITMGWRSDGTRILKPTAAADGGFDLKATCASFAWDCVSKGGPQALIAAMPELGESLCLDDGCAAWGQTCAAAIACLCSGDHDAAWRGSSSSSNNNSSSARDGRSDDVFVCNDDDDDDDDPTSSVAHALRDLAMSLVLAHVRGFVGKGKGAIAQVSAAEVASFGASPEEEVRHGGEAGACPSVVGDGGSGFGGGGGGLGRRGVSGGGGGGGRTLFQRLVWVASRSAAARQSLVVAAEAAAGRILSDARFNLEEVLCGTAPPCEFRDVIDGVASIFRAAVHEAQLKQQQQPSEHQQTQRLLEAGLSHLWESLNRCVADDLERTDNQGYAAVVVQWFFGEHCEPRQGGGEEENDNRHHVGNMHEEGYEEKHNNGSPPSMFGANPTHSHGTDPEFGSLHAAPPLSSPQAKRPSTHNSQFLSSDDAEDGAWLFGEPQSFSQDTSGQHPPQFKRAGVHSGFAEDEACHRAPHHVFAQDTPGQQRPFFSLEEDEDELDSLEDD